LREVIVPLQAVDGVQAPTTPIIPTYGPVLNADSIKEWKIKDCTARRILLSTIEQKLQNTLVGCKTAHDIWTRLNNQQNKCAVNKNYVAQRGFMNYSYVQGNLFSLSFVTKTKRANI
jgi:hypothetical protein